MHTRYDVDTDTVDSSIRIHCNCTSGGTLSVDITGKYGLHFCRAFLLCVIRARAHGFINAVCACYMYIHLILSNQREILVFFESKNEHSTQKSS